MPKVGELRAGDLARAKVKRVRRATMVNELLDRVKPMDLDSVYRIPTFAEVGAAGLARREKEWELPY